jgi:hypothetical protein
VIDFCGVVVDFGGFDFILEVAEIDSLAISGDFDGPSLFMCVPGDSLCILRSRDS